MGGVETTASQLDKYRYWKQSLMFMTSDPDFVSEGASRKIHFHVHNTPQALVLRKTLNLLNVNAIYFPVPVRSGSRLGELKTLT